MQEFRIRRGEGADAAALAEIGARTFVDTFAGDNRPEDMQAHLVKAFGVPQQSAELTDPNEITLLAHRDDVLIGFAQVRRNAPPACVVHEKPIELHRFYVDKSAHGTGVAKVLMAAAHDAAREFDGKHLWLGVWERNARAIAFYAKVGFTKVGTHDFFVGTDRQTDQVLVTALSTHQR